MTDYRRISCQRYAELEVAIVHQLPLRMAWHTPDGGCHIEQLRPCDLRSREHEEFLLAENSRGDAIEIRLDRIARFAPL